MASPNPVDCLGGWILPASGCFCDCVSQSMAFVLWPIMWECLDQATGTCCVFVHGGGYGLVHFMPGPKDEPP